MSILVVSPLPRLKVSTSINTRGYVEVNYSATAYANNEAIGKVAIFTDEQNEPITVDARSRVQFNLINAVGLTLDTTLRLGGLDIAALTFPSDYLGQYYRFFYSVTGRYYKRMFNIAPVVDLDS